MTEKQRQLASENHNLIYSFLNKYHYDLDDFYDLAAIGLCRAAMSYDNSKGTFSTHAYKCMFNEISHYFTIQGASKRIPSNLITYYNAKKYNNVGDNYETEAIGEYLDCLDFIDGFEDKLIFDLCVSNVRRRMSDRDRLIFDMLIDGYTTREIGKAAGCSNVNVTLVRRKICGLLEGLV